MSQPAKHRTLAAKFTVFTAVLVYWVVAVTLSLDFQWDTSGVVRGAVSFLVVGAVAAAIAWFTIRQLVRPLALLREGISAVSEGRLEPIQYGKTGDEIEFLGEKFNQMIAALAASRLQIWQHQEDLEEKIQKRTEELEAAMQKALAASQAKSKFLANMSHELRTPLAGIIGMIDLVLDSPLSGEQQEQLEADKRCAHSLLALLNDILDLSKIESGRMVFEQIPFCPRRVVEDCVRAEQPGAIRKGLSLTCEVDSALPPRVVGDPLRLRQIVANLLSNAVKFTENGSVQVTVRSCAGKHQGKTGLKIEVADTGVGIPEDKLPLIFDKFTQADSSISRRFGGTGLGLAITRKLVEMHAGRIWVESKVGAGSTFHVEMELGEALPDASPPPASDSQEQSGAGRGAEGADRGDILVVEDNQINQKVMSGLLARKGYRITVANNGQEALEALERGRFDLVLMDVQMPVLDGIEATRHIRAQSRWRDLPIIAVTAHAMLGDRERCLAAGMDGYISKPINAAHLLALVERYIPSNGRPAPEEIPRRAAETSPAQYTSEESSLTESMLQLFRQLAPERLQKLQVATVRGHSADLLRHAEALRSAAEHIQAGHVVECARRIEEAARRSDFAAAQRELLELQKEIADLDPAVPRKKRISGLLRPE